MTSPRLTDHPTSTAGRDNIRRLLGRPATDPVTVPTPGIRPGVDLARILMWTREGIVGARDRWPDLVEDKPAVELMHERERQNREMTADGNLQVVMVMITPDDLADFALRTAGDPMDTTTRNALLVERFNAGVGQVWPPERNTVCWCGSGTKYKKCCGTPNL